MKNNIEILESIIENNIELLKYIKDLSLSINGLEEPYIDHNYKITRKQLEVMHRLINTDSTITEIAGEMCISPITAHQHISGARKSFGAKTNIGAIVKAVKAGVLSID